MDAEVGQDRVDAVDAGAGHQPHEVLGAHRSFARRCVLGCVPLLDAGEGDAVPQRELGAEHGDASEIAGERGNRQRLRRRQRDRHRVALFVIDPKFVVQMRTGRPARLADVADDVALRDARSGLDAAREPRQMRVDGRIGRAMLQHDRVAVAVLPPGGGNLAVA